MKKKIVIITIAIIPIIVSFWLINSNNKLKTNKITNQNNNESQNEINNVKEEDKMPKLNIKIENKIYTATLYNNETTREFIRNLPLTINMSELNGNEKYYYMANSFQTNSENVKSINKGDIMLYGSNCLVLFYKSFSTNYSYTKLGYIDDTSTLEETIGKEDINITFELHN